MGMVLVPARSVDSGSLGLRQGTPCLVIGGLGDQFRLRNPSD